ncbi:GDSL-type esterase/lipase family protein [Apilactobacillus apisilvae]|uniref:GDSL-type esterase/lipase family protein n=1 Tax=Apilactobacillus apisilvae TaxID=2923364 RepID=A0ABY4PIT0_9LACO|nr:GDSL-type esterase/lipase family protein [Apilactobacillus apisilvae]
MCGGFYVYKSVKSDTSHHYNNKKVTFVALGDSLTQGVGDTNNQGGYVGRIKNKLIKYDNAKVSVRNYGIAGQRSDQINERLLNNTDKLATNVKHANSIFLSAGGNDLLQTLQKNALVNDKDKFSISMNKSLNQYKNNLNSLIQHLRQVNKKSPIYIFSVYNPVYVYFPNVHAISEYVDKYNSVTSEIVNKQKKMHFVNINDLSYGQYKTESQRDKLAKDNNNDIDPLSIAKLYDDKSELNDYLSTKDHFHPNNLGYDFMTDKLFNSMQKYNDWYYIGS